MRFDTDAWDLFILAAVVFLMQRFADVKSATPAPGAYNDPRNALETLKKISGLKKSPFGQTDARFKPARGAETPGELFFLSVNTEH